MKLIYAITESKRRIALIPPPDVTDSEFGEIYGSLSQAGLDGKNGCKTAVKWCNPNFTYRFRHEEGHLSYGFFKKPIDSVEEPHECIIFSLNSSLEAGQVNIEDRLFAGIASITEKLNIELHKVNVRNLDILLIDMKKLKKDKGISELDNEEMASGYITRVGLETNFEPKKERNRCVLV